VSSRDHLFAAGIAPSPAGIVLGPAGIVVIKFGSCAHLEWPPLEMYFCGGDRSGSVKRCLLLSMGARKDVRALGKHSQ
jgi:hypothetical protein